MKTKDGKLVFIEVSSHHSLDDAVSTAQRKLAELSALNFDAFFYIAPLEIQEYFPIGDNAFVLGLKHFPKLAEIIKGILDQKIKTTRAPQN